MITMQTQLLNDTKSSGGKIDCAKECPCGVPVIPVPDQWLEVMVTGGFKVWHIIFIIIAFIVTMTVVYCCFHRCRIPRTKQEIEADLMRSNLTNKFRDYLQELPNEPTTFVEALKKVQELEEKVEQDNAQLNRDLGVRKRMGWLNLKGKDDKSSTNEASKQTNQDSTVNETANPEATTDNKPQQSNGTELALPKANVEPVEPIKEQVSLTLPDEAPKAEINTEATDGQQQPVNAGTDDRVDNNKGSPKQTRRRRHKPNLSRSKRARENPQGDLEIDRPPIMTQSPEPQEPSRQQPSPPQTPTPQPVPPVVSHKHRAARHHRVRTQPKRVVAGEPDT